jgi:hypothetical protein
MKKLLKVIFYAVLGICSAGAALLGAAGLCIAVTEFLPGVFHGPDMSGNAGWAIFGVMLFGGPSVLLLGGGLAGLRFMRNRWIGRGNTDGATSGEPTH